MKRNQWIALENEFEDPASGGGQSSGAGAAGAGEDAMGGDQSSGAAAPAFDPNKFAQEFGRSFAQSLPQQQQQKPAMTDEEFRKQTGYYAVSKQDVEEMFGMPPEGVDPDKFYGQKQAVMQRMLDGMATHANKVSGLLSQVHMRDITTRFEPLVQEVNQKKFDTYVGGVASDHPVLKEMGDKGKELVRTAIGMLQQQGYVPQNPATDKQMIHMACQKIVELAGGQFSASASGGGGRASSGGMPGGVNGAGGSGSGAGKQGKKSGWEALPF